MNIAPSTSTAAPIEPHPLRPFLPATGRVLLLGSFPPPQKRWSMTFFYPNFQNDMWRIIGLIFKQDKNAFVDAKAKCFKLDLLRPFLEQTGLAFFDTASAVRRLQGNASDKFLEIVSPTDIAALLAQMPQCRTVVATGQKAAETLCDRLHIAMPPIGEGVPFSFDGMPSSFSVVPYRFFRMPSTSRAYPLQLEKKALIYARMFVAAGILPTLPYHLLS